MFSARRTTEVTGLGKTDMCCMVVGRCAAAAATEVAGLGAADT